MADVLLFGRGLAMLRSPELEAKRQRRIAIVRVAAFGRAQAGKYSVSDQALFGPVDQLLAEGPRPDPRLAAPITGGPHEPFGAA